MSTYGYIATLDGKPLRLFADGILCLGRETTMFATRREAKEALEATVAYGIKRGYYWGRGYGIVRVAARLLLVVFALLSLFFLVSAMAGARFLPVR
jgi:hypothetical protein